MTESAATWVIATAVILQGYASRAADSPNPRSVRITEIGAGRLRHAATIRSCVFSPDGKLVASGSDDGHVRIWNATDGGIVATFSVDGPVSSLSFASDGNSLFVGTSATSSTSGAVFRGRVAKESHLERLHRGSLPISNVVLSHSDKKVAIVEGGGAITIATLALSERPVRLNTATDVLAVAFSKDDKHLFSCTTSGRVTIWDAPGGDAKSSFDVGEIWLSCFGRIKDAEVLICADKEDVLCWDVASGKRKWNATIKGAEASAVHCGRDVVAVGDKAGFTTLISVVDGRVLRRVGSESQGSIRALAISPDGTTIGIAGDSQSVLLIEIATGLKKLKDTFHLGPIADAASSTDGRQIVSVGVDGTVIVWDASGTKILKTMSCGRKGVCSASYDGSDKVAVGDREGWLSLLLLSTEKVLWTREAHFGAVRDVAWSQDSIVTCGAEGEVKAWGIEKGAPRASFAARGDIRKVAVSLSGRIAFVGVRGDIWIGNIADFKFAVAAKMERDVVSLEFDSDCKKVFAIASNGEVRVQSLVSNEESLSFSVRGGPSSSAWMGAQKQIAVGTVTGEICLIDVTKRGDQPQMLTKLSAIRGIRLNTRSELLVWTEDAKLLTVSLP